MYARRDSASFSDIKVSENMTSYCNGPSARFAAALGLIDLLVEKPEGHHER